MTMAKKLITVDQARLEAYLARFCGNYYKMDSGKVICSKRRPDGCNIDHIDKIVYNCPHDCPHLSESKWQPCKAGQCSFVKNAIKEITKED